MSQVIVEGTLAQVDRVDSLRATIDLSDQRSRFTGDLSLTPISANGTILNDVEVRQQTVGVTIDVRQREDVLAIPIRPVIDFDSAAPGYAVRLDNYMPQTAIIRGSPATLAMLPDLLDTATIDLTGRTSSSRSACRRCCRFAEQRAGDDPRRTGHQRANRGSGAAGAKPVR